MAGTGSNRLQSHPQLISSSLAGPFPLDFPSRFTPEYSHMATINIADELNGRFRRQCAEDFVPPGMLLNQLILYYLGENTSLNIHLHHSASGADQKASTMAKSMKNTESRPAGRPPKPPKPRKIPHSLQADTLRSALRQITQEDRDVLKLDPFTLLSRSAEFIDELGNLYDNDGCSLDPIGQSINWCGVPPHWVNLPAGVERTKVWHPEGHDIYRDPSAPVKK